MRIGTIEKVQLCIDCLEPSCTRRVPTLVANLHVQNTSDSINTRALEERMHLIDDTVSELRSWSAKDRAGAQACCHHRFKELLVCADSSPMRRPTIEFCTEMGERDITQPTKVFLVRSGGTGKPNSSSPSRHEVGSVQPMGDACQLAFDGSCRAWTNSSHRAWRLETHPRA